MKPFLVYTLLRVALFVGALGLVGGIWKAASGDDEVPLVWVVVIAFLLSGVASLFLLDRQRQEFGARVEQRAARASARFEERRAAEDADNG